jgi:uncharacterized OB-fold protein
MPGPAPVVDEDSRHYWEALRQHRLLLQRCRACDRLRFPPMPTCPFCASRDTDETEVSGRGTIYSWISVERALDPAFAADVPFVVAVVELDEGPRVVGRIRGTAGAGTADFGTGVQAEYVDHDGWTELRFSPV